MRFIDSNILAYAFYENENRERCINIVKEGGIIDSLCLIEAFNIIENETRKRDIAVEAIKSLMKINLEIVNVDSNVVFEALKKAEKYKKLKFLDLIHYIIALNYECKEILSYDKDFNDLEIKKTEP
ncbi:MAG: PIN domain-containing protein [Nanoarchaeota archaeon]|nr:PIN domain-containing protein [Nanoarchaeota archaeon]